MIEVKITKKMKDTANQKAKKLGQLKKSITGGEGNVAGFLGEEVVKKYIGGDLANEKDYDLILEDKKYDIKTKRCTSEPKPDYDCSIAAYNTVQKCDGYIFVRIEQDKETKEWGRAWILGWMDKKGYFEKARKLFKGQRDGHNWFKVKADCYNLPISELKSIDEIK